MASLERQQVIDKIFRKPPAQLTSSEASNVLLIAALTPAEYDAVGVHIRVQSVKDIAGGKIEVRLHGRHSDADYVRGALNNLKGVQTTEPQQVPGAPSDLLFFQVKGSKLIR